MEERYISWLIAEEAFQRLSVMVLQKSKMETEMVDGSEDHF